jgi:hypothetical protein
LKKTAVAAILSRMDLTDEAAGASIPATGRAASWRARLRRHAPLLVSVALLTALLSRFRDYGLLLRLNPWWLALALAQSLAVNFFVGARKWQLVMRQSAIEVGYGETLGVWTGLYPLTFFMPFQSGHVLYAVALKRMKALPWFAAIESVVYDRCLTLVGAFAFLGVGQAFLERGDPFSNAWIAAGAAAVVALFFMDDRVLARLGRFGWLRGRSRLAEARPTLAAKLRLLALAVAYQGTDVLGMALILRAMDCDVPAAAILGVFPLVLLLSYAPISFHGIGVREGLIALLMARWLDFDQAIAVGLLISFVECLAPALAGLAAVGPAWRALGGGGSDPAG